MRLFDSIRLTFWSHLITGLTKSGRDCLIACLNFTLVVDLCMGSWIRSHKVIPLERFFFQALFTGSFVLRGDIKVHWLQLLYLSASCSLLLKERLYITVECCSNWAAASGYEGDIFPYSNEIYL